MKIELKGNPNYCATIVQIDSIIELEDCTQIQGTIIQGNHVIISKDVKISEDARINDIGIFFPIECSIKEIFLRANNLYRDKELNEDKTKSGFFELNGRVRCVKLRGFKSEGFFIPLQSINFLTSKDTIFDLTKNIPLITIGTDFDHINGQMICEKYFVPTKQVQNVSKKDKKNNRIKRFNKLLDNQFKFHIDTAQLAKNIHMIQPNNLISITEKIHGTSAITSYILCNRKLTLKDKIVKFFGVKVEETEYSYIYASRKVIKNQYLYEDKLNHYYTTDIWKVGAEELKPFLQKDMTIYYEIVGYLSDSKMVQKSFDYGCRQGQHEKYIYRITTTNSDGKVTEWSMFQIQQWCKQNGLKAVLEHYYGYAKDLFKEIIEFTSNDIETWQHLFLEKLQETYLEKQCSMCLNKVPNEGICLRKESLNIEVWKLKSFLFKQLESKQADEGLENIEDNQGEEI